jgi:hypothetical protein
MAGSGRTGQDGEERIGRQCMSHSLILSLFVSYPQNSLRPRRPLLLGSL